jgi:hypothetical protein
VVASASTIMIATSSPAIRPATTMSNTAGRLELLVGREGTHWSSIRATRVAPTGPQNGRPESWVLADAALIGHDVVLVLGVQRHHRDDDLDLVAQALREGRAQRPVDQAAGEDGVLGRPALAAEERAGDPAGGVHPLLDVHREGEEVEVLLGVLAGRGGRQQHGVVVEVRGDGAGGLTGQAAGLEPDGAGAEAAVVDHGVGGVDGVVRHTRVTLLFVAGRAGRDAGLRWKPAGSRWCAVVRGPLPRTGTPVASRSSSCVWCGSYLRRPSFSISAR